MWSDADNVKMGMRHAWGGERPFGLSPADRRHHCYVIGQTGTGKTTLVTNLIVQDIEAGRGVGVIDPHGDLAEELLDCIPPWRMDHVVYFDPADRAYPVGLNLLRTAPRESRHLAASGIVSALKSVWRESWGPRLEYVLYASVAALLDCDNVTLLGVQRMLSDARYRDWVVRQVKDPVVRSFWEREFAGYDRRFVAEVTAPIQNKVGQLLMSPPIRNVLGQVGAKVDPAFMMNTGRMLFYAMELIEGVRIDEHVGKADLSRQQTLELMQIVCQAVHHAHQLGVIHRDLKPSNILVDKAGKPHVLDFGLAKELWAESSPQITLDDALGTPAYMSPEQARGDSRRVGTASDVYALGVILYQLLLGRLPHDVSGSSVEVMRRISSEEPARPRTIDPKLPRDLEAILLKALAREPEQRYTSADALGQDLQRFVQGLAIHDTRLGLRYVIGKYIRRHRYRITTAAALVLVICGISIAAYVRVIRERDRAQTSAEVTSAVNEFLLKMLRSADPESTGGPITLHELLDRAASDVDGAFLNKPLVESAVRTALANTYVRLGLASKAEPHARAALQLQLEHRGPDHVESLSAVGDLAFVLYNSDRHVEAEQLLKPALMAARERQGSQHDVTLRLIRHLIAALYYQGRLDETDQYTRELYAIHLKLYGPEDRRTLAAAEMLATTCTALGRFEEAEKILLHSVAQYAADRARSLPELCSVHLRLGSLYATQQRLTEAEDALERCVETRIALYGPRHGSVSYAKAKLSNVYERQGKLLQAEQAMRESLAIDEPLIPGAARLIEQYLTLARLLDARGQTDESDQMIQRAVAVAEAKLNDSVSPDVKAVQDYCDGLVRLHLHRQAEDYASRAVTRARRTLPAGHKTIEHFNLILSRIRTSAPAPERSSG